MFLNIFLEVILITILIGGSRYGYNKGFFKMAAGPVRLLLCIALSFFFSRTVAINVVAPLIISRTSESLARLALPAINAISTAVAFLFLFAVIKIILSFIISLLSRILDEGIVGKINRALGLLLAGIFALIGSMCFATLAEYLFSQEAFIDSELLKDFSGGPFYRLFTLINPVRLNFTQ